MKHGHGARGRESGPPPGGHLLSKAIHDNMAAEVLVEMTGKSLKEVKAEMADTHMMKVLLNNNIDPHTSKTRMDTKMATATKKAVSCGLITAEQAAEIRVLKTRLCNRGTFYRLNQCLAFHIWFSRIRGGLANCSHLK